MKIVNKTKFYQKNNEAFIYDKMYVKPSTYQKTPSEN